MTFGSYAAPFLRPVAGADQSWNAAPVSISASASSMPQAARASRVCWPALAAGPAPKVEVVRLNRGAGAGWVTPWWVTYNWRACRCGW